MASVTAASGFDLGYPLQGTADAGERTAGGYYMSAAQGGEAPGRWAGRGAAALGLEGEVKHADYLVLYGERPVNPATGEPLGGARRDYSRAYQAKLDSLLSAEPEATMERRAELERQAKRETRQSPVYTDITAEHGKSISILHGSIRENARRAREAGDEELAAWWDTRELQFSEVLQRANAAALDHLQDWAGVTRTGHHGRKVDDRELGKWEDAELIVASWLQGTSRAGEMHDHIHNTVHPKVRTVSDGKWRGVDTMAVRRQLPALAAIESAYTEAALSAEFGVQWVPRADGMGNEIAGITQAEIDAYSSRREAVTQKQDELAREFHAKYSREPSQREMRILHDQAWAITRPAKGSEPTTDGLIDWDKTAALWDDALGGKLGAVAGRVSNLAPGRVTSPETRAAADGPVLARAARQALAAVQAKQPSWSRADLMRQVQIAVPAEAKGTDPEAAVRLVGELTDRAIAGEFEAVEKLDTEAVPVPAHLLREIDGRSVYTRPGTEKYCTRIQLGLEEKLLNAAEARSAPVLSRELAATLLGANADSLEAALHGGQGDELTGSGLRADQAAALWYMLSQPATASVLVGPAGSGKTRTLAEAAKAWINGTGGQVIGLATAQAARNVLAEAGVELSENTAQFLGHLPGERGARGIRDLAPGSLVVVDEGSMMSTQDLHDILSYARQLGCKVLVAGDHQQLAAVEGGGGMMLLARRLGFVQLREAVRFREQWERTASLQVRRGEERGLDAYDMRGRITGDIPERCLDAAAADYLGHHLAGENVLMMARSNETCAELSRRVREELVHLGQVDDERTAELMNGARCGAGDLIIARRNDRMVRADGRTLANGDLLRVESVNDDGSLTVRRGEGEAFRFADLASAHLGYAATGHVAQGRTVQAGIAVVTGSESRQWLYTTMTRGAEINRVYVFTQPKVTADVSEGTAPAPELDRARRMARERAGEEEEQREPESDPEPRDPRAVLADVLERDGTQKSALETRDEEIANADHLAVLDTMWQGETGDARTERYKAAIRDALPAGTETDLDSSYATWLWRELRHAEACGKDAREVVREALEHGSLTGARNVAAVLRARIEKQTAGLRPGEWVPWSQRVPDTGDPQRDEHLRQLAAAMDDRKARLGEFTAETAPEWAVRALGPVPGGDGREEWAERAGHVAAYRELYGWDGEGIGPEPRNSPEARAAWWAGWQAMSPEDPGMAALDDGQLLLRRASYERETGWAPAYPAAELKAASTARLEFATTERLARVRGEAARKAGDELTAARQERIAASAEHNAGILSGLIDRDEALLSDHRDWTERTEGSRELAIQADRELRTRHPDEELEPLRSAEPEPVPEIEEVTDEAISARIEENDARRLAYDRAREERDLVQPGEHEDYEPEGPAWPGQLGREAEPILVPPKPEMPAPAREREPVIQAGAADVEMAD